MIFVFDVLVPVVCATCLFGPVPTPAIVLAAALPFSRPSMVFFCSLFGLIVFFKRR